MHRARPARAAAALALLAFSLLALASCGRRAIAWGVLLWGDTAGPFATGSVVAINRESQLADTFLVSAKGSREQREFTRGRVRRFARRAGAEAEAERIRPWLATWAFSRKQEAPPLPIRETADSSSRTVYRLRHGQLVKVIGRSAERVQIEPYTDWWYEVATEDGYAGWTFGHYLEVFEVEGDPSAEQERLLSTDETLERILATVWRPDSFNRMIADGRIDLRAFREDVGLFPDRDNRLFRLGLTRETIEFPYQRIEPSGSTTYTAVGADLRITVLDEARISIAWRRGAEQGGGLYAAGPSDVAAVIAAEQERRRGLFEALLGKGTTLTSSSYGTIRLEPGMRFTWKGFERLVPAYIAAKAAGTGRVDFPYHVGKTLAGRYDGVLTFVFDDGAGEASFLVTNAAGGLRLTALGSDAFEELDAVRVGISPVVIFFAQSP